ncbi:putative aromatic amino acid decarboxylase [Cladochytrium replicatum]|nr:putative aromatic amino acid decarboxylase [Cladochytrium replicatum]
MDADEFRRRGYETIDRIARYYEELEKYPVLSQVTPGYLAKLLPHEAPEDPDDFSLIQKDFEEKIIPGITHWQSPNFFSFFPSNSTFPGILADMYSDMLNVIAFNWQTSPAATELEMLALDWVAKLLGLSQKFLSKSCNPEARGGGVIHGSASEAVCTAIIAACDRAAKRYQSRTGCDDDAVRDFKTKLVAYGSSQTHSCTQKACNMVNLRFHKVQTNAETEYSLKMQALKAAMEADVAKGLVPFFVTVTIGTTSCGAVDDISAICDAVTNTDVWVHVDAAWAGVATACEEFRPYLEGTEKADSFSTNMHKWGLTNFDCCCFWVQDSTALVDALSLTPPYLRNKASDTGLVIDYRDWQMPLGRRFRSLKLWFVLRTYGAKGLRAHIRKHVDQAKYFLGLLEASNDLFSIKTSLKFSLLTFQVLPPKGTKLSVNEVTKKTYDAVMASGDIMITSSILDPDDYVIRFVPGSPQTELRHVIAAFECIKKHAQIIINQAK